MMTKFATKLAATGAAIIFGAGVASASILDFTDPSSYTLGPSNTASGAIDGVGWSLVATGGDINDSETGPGAIGPLAGITDGLGIVDDEVTFSKEMFDLTFDQEVTVLGLFFLDLFEANDGSSEEIAMVSVDGGAPLSFGALVPFSDGVGFGSFDTSLTGTTFSFSVMGPNDNVASPDYALAGLDLAPIPLPAGAFLLGGALLGLGALRRRKSQAA